MHDMDTRRKYLYRASTAANKVEPKSTEPKSTEYRFVEKYGHINVDYESVQRIQSIHSNFIIFIMEAEWWLVITLFVCGFVSSWIMFAFLYFLVSIEHGDFVLTAEEQQLLDINATLTPSSRETCVHDVHDFFSALLFSIETQLAIGYGSRYITTECMGGVLLLTIQSTLGYILQVIVAQVVFTKLSRPTEKSQYVVFSEKAVILPRDNELGLAFRIGNLSSSQMIFANVRLLMIRSRTTEEGEIIPHQIYDMELTRLRNGQLFFPRPTIVEHIIDRNSPLYSIQRATLPKQKFELIAIIEGAFDCTGFSCHFRTSYLPSEILWGYRFGSCDSSLQGFDYKKFNDVDLVDGRATWVYDRNTSPEIGIDNVTNYFSVPDLQSELLNTVSDSTIITSLPQRKKITLKETKSEPEDTEDEMEEIIVEQKPLMFTTSRQARKHVLNTSPQILIESNIY
ncbi:unnamed protein product [Didymodactylos carnosus]|uniref:Uncharacterized protein n=1 Tax=Didymodactylos carnosus TaxID=1234261 RepID=A0A8S2GU92_9BILA|nr:unnamed protein product [Didymodactylos carnosus]CAF3557746.1 unnamed protein product [Didymodactylos carnosus]